MFISGLGLIRIGNSILKESWVEIPWKRLNWLIPSASFHASILKLAVCNRLSDAIGTRSLSCDVLFSEILKADRGCAAKSVDLGSWIVYIPLGVLAETSGTEGRMGQHLFYKRSDSCRCHWNYYSSLINVRNVRGIEKLSTAGGARRARPKWMSRRLLKVHLLCESATAPFKVSKGGTVPWLKKLAQGGYLAGTWGFFSGGPWEMKAGLKRKIHRRSLTKRLNNKNNSPGALCLQGT